MISSKYKLPQHTGRGPSNYIPNGRPIGSDNFEYIGTIVSVNPISLIVNVMTEQGTIDHDILILNQGTAAFERSQTWIQSLRGKKAVVKSIGGVKFLIGTLPSNISTSDTTEDFIPFAEKETAGDAESTYKAGLINNINIARKDYLDGDKVLSTSDNTSLGLFKGGLSNWKVSNLTQIILHKLKGLIRMVTRNFELFTDFGSITVLNTEDKTTLKIEGGASFKDETMPGVDKYSVTLEMGAVESDDKLRMKLSIVDPEQDSNKVDVGIGIDGIIKIECSDKVEITAEKEAEVSSEKIAIKSSKEIELSADQDLTITSSQGLTLNANKSVEITSKGGITLQSSAQGTNIKSDGIIGIKGQLIQLN